MAIYLGYVGIHVGFIGSSRFMQFNYIKNIVPSRHSSCEVDRTVFHVFSSSLFKQLCLPRVSKKMQPWLQLGLHQKVYLD